MQLKNFPFLLFACLLVSGAFFLCPVGKLHAANESAGLSTKSAQGSGDPAEPVEASTRYESRYETSLAKALGRLDQAMKDISDEKLKKSLQLTREAGVLYLSRSRLSRASQILKEALAADPENSLAYLVHADVSVLLGNKAEGGKSYFEFWHTARKRKNLLRAVFDPQDRRAIASHISGRLFIYGMDLPIEEPKDLPLLMEMNLEQPPLRVLLLTYGLPILVFVGILFFTYRRLFNPDVSPTSDRALLQTYLVVLAAYLAWLAHMIARVPALFGSPVKEVYGILAIGFIGILLYRFLSRAVERIREERDPATIFCPKCGKSVLKVAVICPFCSAPVTEGRKKIKVPV